MEKPASIRNGLMQSFHKSLITGSHHAFNSLAGRAGSCPSFIRSSINYLVGRFEPQACMYMSVQKVTQSVTLKSKICHCTLMYLIFLVIYSSNRVTHHTTKIFLNFAVYGKKHPQIVITG